MAYGSFKDLARKASSDKFLRDLAFNFAKNPKYDGYQRGLATIVYKLFDKKSKDDGFNRWNSHTNHLLEKFKKEGFSLHLETIFGVLI